MGMNIIENTMGTFMAIGMGMLMGTRTNAIGSQYKTNFITTTEHGRQLVPHGSTLETSSVKK
jgi:hypothetical protein